MISRFTIYEHSCLEVDRIYNGVLFKEDHRESLERFFKEKDFPYYRLVRNGVRFCQYVGVIQTPNCIIEVLPKADSTVGEKSDEKASWRRLMIDMLRAVGAFNVTAPSQSSLKLKTNSILELYFLFFVEEVENLLRLGLVKKYRGQEGNLHTLKGALLFAKNIKYNLVHKERFYVRHVEYDQIHFLNAVLWKTIHFLKVVNKNNKLDSRIGNLLLNFPEMPDIGVSEEMFSRINFNRKTESYKKAIIIARMLLLNYHPDINKGRNDILALMFNMNDLWEKFVYCSLEMYKPPGYEIYQQTETKFWKREGVSPQKMRTDIVVQTEKYSVVLDTKWKLIGEDNPSPDDLRQMYTYSKYNGGAETALVYPGKKSRVISGRFRDELEVDNYTTACSLIFIHVGQDIREWKKEIARTIYSSHLFVNE